jgi:hypothetical protein
VWELNVVVTANAGCAKIQQSLIDKMLRVKQIGDARYQSRLWTFVADLAREPGVHQTALLKAVEVLPGDARREPFRASMDCVRWLRLHDEPAPGIEAALDDARAAVEEEAPEFVVARILDRTVQEISELGKLMTVLGDVPEEDELATPLRPGKGGAKGKQGKQIPGLEDLKTEPATVADWVSLFQVIDHRKSITVSKPFTSSSRS